MSALTHATKATNILEMCLVKAKVASQSDAWLPFWAEVRPDLETLAAWEVDWLRAGARSAQIRACLRASGLAA